MLAKALTATVTSHASEAPWTVTECDAHRQAAAARSEADRRLCAVSQCKHPECGAEATFKRQLPEGLAELATDTTSHDTVALALQCLGWPALHLPLHHVSEWGSVPRARHQTDKADFANLAQVGMALIPTIVFAGAHRGLLD